MKLTLPISFRRALTLGLVLTIFAWTHSAAATGEFTWFAQEAAASLPDTPAGKTFKEFLKAFNTGEVEALKRFHRERGGDEGFAQKDMGFFKETGGLVVHRITRSTPLEIEVLAKAVRGNEWFQFGMTVTPSEPHGVAGIRVEPTDPPQKGAGEQPASKSATRPAGMTDEEAPAAIANLLKGLVEKDEFSGVVLVAKNGKPLFHQAYGLANKEYKVANRPDTKFNLGSINKLFTQVAIRQLVESKRLSLSDTIGKFLPDYPNKQAAEKVTVGQLIEMESGIADFFGPEYEATPKNKLRTLADYIPLFATKPLAFEPGTRRAYSNGGYIVLGAIIEKASGENYFDYVRNHIFKPAGMEATDSYEIDGEVPNRATGYTLKAANSNGRRISDVYTKPARGSSAGGGYSTAEDLLKFALALQARKLLSPAGTMEMIGEGLGFAGGSPGTNAALEFSPVSGYTVIVLSNYDPPSATDIARQLRQWFGMD